MTKRAGRLLPRVLGRAILGVVVLAGAAYVGSRFGLLNWPRAYDPLALPDLDARPGLLTGWQLSLAEGDEAGCGMMLRRAGLNGTLLPVRGAGTACEVRGAVELSRLSTARLNPEETRCAMAARLYLWEKHLLQPAAQRHFNEAVTEILHFGSFSCRTMRGRSSMSEHATANAFDISGFRLASGKMISVKRDWPRDSLESKFLRVARDGLCDWFNVTLSPDYNAAHADHFHVDMGWYRTCR